jgi:hypothetical protein
MRAVYDLSKCPANFNVCEFLSAASAYGAEEVVFCDTKGLLSKYSRERTEERIANILVPACGLIGLKYSFGPKTGEYIEPGYKIQVVMEAYKKTGKIGKFRSDRPAGEKYTVTLRNYDRYEDRNSDRDAWAWFAKEIGAYVIEEWYDEPISLEDRMALYAGAEMNYFVGNGPAALCVYSDYPYTMILKTDYEGLELQGMNWGDQYPWVQENQRCIWGTDNIETLRALLPNRLSER